MVEELVKRRRLAHRIADQRRRNFTEQPRIVEQVHEALYWRAFLIQAVDEDRPIHFRLNQFGFNKFSQMWPNHFSF